LIVFEIRERGGDEIEREIGGKIERESPLEVAEN